MVKSVTMPQLGESITEGTISRWLKKIGDPVQQYESLVEVITDKVNAEVPAPLAGVLKEIKVQEGATVTVGTEICVIEETAGRATAPGPEGGLGGHAGMTPEPLAGPPREPAALAEQEEAGEGRPRLSPAVRALVDEHGMTDAELAQISGSGLGGRISKKDVEDYLARRARPAPSPAAASAPAAVTAPPVRPGDESQPLSPMRRSIAANMLKSKQTIPHAWTVAEVDMTRVVHLRGKVKESFRQREGIDLTFVPIVIKGVVEGLRANPNLNASWGEDRIILHRDINVGVAVAVGDGLIVPVIHHADQLSIAGLAQAVDDLARRARAGKLTLQDVQGGTFTVNNPGTFGTVLSYAIVNSPQAAILSMEGIVKRPVVVEGDAIAVRSMMNLCLSFDHRVLDGASAARFLQALRHWLEGFSEEVPIY